VSVDIRRHVYGFAIQTADDQTAAWTVLWTRYTRATLAQDRDDLLYSLCQTTDINLMHRLVSLL